MVIRWGLWVVSEDLFIYLREKITDSLSLAGKTKLTENRKSLCGRGTGLNAPEGVTDLVCKKIEGTIMLNYQRLPLSCNKCTS